MRTIALTAAVLGLVVAALLAPTASAATLTPEDAILHVGRSATVCGRVVDAAYAVEATGQPTFLNFGKPYPDQSFTALIWGSTRPAFPRAPESWLGATICVRGRITTYRGKAQIVVTEPAQIEPAAEGPGGPR